MGAIRHFHVEGDKRPTLKDDTHVWRYVPLKQLLVYLGGRVFIPSIETLRKQDPFEGELYYDRTCFGEAIKRWYGERGIRTVLGCYYRNTPFALLKDNVERTAYLETLRATRAAWCWFEATENVESAAMWRLYGKDGVAVLSTVGRIKNALATSEYCFEFGRMWYLRVDHEGVAVDQEELFPEGQDFYSELTLRSYFVKRAEYSSEKEVRFIASTALPSPGANLLLPPDSWIDEIRLNPGFHQTEIDAIRRAAGAAHIQCSQSGMLRKTTPDIEEYVRENLVPEVPTEMQQLWPIR